jgi:hypothetical protein
LKSFSNRSPASELAARSRTVIRLIVIVFIGFS